MKTEKKRQLIHLMLGVFYTAIVFFIPKEQSLIVLLGIFGLGSLASYTHAHVTPLPFLKDILEKVQRKKETHIPGRAALSFTLGIILSAILFYNMNNLVLIGAIIAVTFGDGFSTIIGKWKGKRKTTNNKTLEGTIGGIVAATIVLSLFFKPEIAVATAIFAMLAEYIPINDNYAIPLVSGLVLVFLI